MARHADCELEGIAGTNGQILQLTSLLPTAEQFAILLRDALKSQVSERSET